MSHQIPPAPPPAPLPARLPDWPERLAAMFTAHAELPFRWGEHDCFIFAAAAVQALTGADPLGALRGQWYCRRSAAALLRATGGGIAGAVSSRLGPPMASPVWAQRGDIVLVRGAAPGSLHRRWLGVCDADRVRGPGPQGMASVGMEQALLAWGVGHG